jgi:hypothetical protein
MSNAKAEQLLADVFADAARNTFVVQRLHRIGQKLISEIFIGNRKRDYPVGERAIKLVSN